MRKIHLILLVGIALLSVAVFGFNLTLQRLNREAKLQLDAQIDHEKLVNAPSPGWAMPRLKGSASDGRQEEIDLQRSAPKFTLLLFDPWNCGACDANWVFWNKLLADPEINSRFLILTAATSVSEEYWRQHQVTRHPLQAGLDPDIAKQMRMQAAPQTIYLEKGTVKKVWFGLLSDENVKEITQTMRAED